MTVDVSDAKSLVVTDTSGVQFFVKLSAHTFDVYEHKITQRALNWTIARRVEGRLVPLTAEDAAEVLEGLDEDGIFTIKARRTIEADPLLRFESHPKLEVRAARQHAAAALWAALVLITAIARWATGLKLELELEGCERVVPTTQSFCEATTDTYRGAIEACGGLLTLTVTFLPQRVLDQTSISPIQTWARSSALEAAVWNVAGSISSKPGTWKS
ncbi:hypothetical protein V8E36_007549 [Tilletia maclaganii]